MTIERLMCTGNPAHVEENERRLSAAFTDWQRTYGIEHVPWNDQLRRLWRVEKRRLGLRSTIAFDDNGFGCCGVCNEPLVYVTFVGEVETRRRNVVLV